MASCRARRPSSAESRASRRYRRDQPPLPDQGGTSWQHGRSRKPPPPSRPASTPTRSRLASSPRLSRTRRTRRAPCSEPGSVSPLPVLRRRWHSCGNAWLSARKRCGRRDLNPHALRHRNLNPACIPISPLPRVARVYPRTPALRGARNLGQRDHGGDAEPGRRGAPAREVRNSASREASQPSQRYSARYAGVTHGDPEAPPAGWLARTHRAPAHATCLGARNVPRRTHRASAHAPCLACG